MYKVYFVEDEPWVLKDILSIIDYKKYDFEVVGSSSSPIKAIDEILLLHPNLVISDVSMPIMDGIELATKIKALDEDIMFVFLSAYEKFEYAKNAFKLGAFDYLVKPISADGMIAMLSQVKQKIAENFKDKMMEIVLQGDNYSLDQNSLTMLSRFNVVDEEKENRVVVLQGVGNAIIDRKKSNFRLRNDTSVLFESKTVFIALVKMQTGEKLDYDYISKFCQDNNLNVGISEGISSCKNFFKAYRHAIVCSNNYFVNGMAECVIYKDVEDSVDAIIEDIRSFKNKLQFTAFLDSLKNKANTIPLYTDALQSIYEALCDTMQRRNIVNREIVTSDNSILSLFDNLDTFISVMTELLSGENKNFGESYKVVQEIIEDISANYGSKLTLSNYASRYFFNTSYLSQLFSKYAGKSFIDYLVQFRLDKAKQLIVTTSMSLNQISDEVGYPDYFHFSKLFKKYYGVSPRALRNA